MQKGFISLFTLDGTDCMWHDVRDTGSLHRIICSLFGLHEGEDKKINPGEIQWRLVSDSRYDGGIKLLILSVESPTGPGFGKLETKPIPENLLSADDYHFSIRVNPTRRDVASRKLIPLTKTEEIVQWFARKAEASGFFVEPSRIAVNRRKVVTFKKKSGKVTMFQVDLSGVLHVINRERFIKTFFRGFGRGRAFGCGLFQVAPIINNIGDHHE